MPGLSLAIIRQGKIESVGGYGIRDAREHASVTERTVFEAASLSKPVFAYAVLQLVDSGALSLDEPLSMHVPDHIPGDQRAAGITACHVLAHMTGLPNWRSAEHPLKTYFAPGKRFSYSGEAYAYLQRVVERITGEPLDGSMRRLVFEPLAMRDSSYVWQERFDADYARPHGSDMQAASKSRPAVANAAYSLQTTAADYARFIEAMLAGARLETSTADRWVVPKVNVPRGRFVCLDAEGGDRDERVAWSLGWGIESGAGTFFHWGANDGFAAFVVGSRNEGTAVVVLTNGDNGLRVMRPIIAPVLTGDRPSLSWLGY